MSGSAPADELLRLAREASAQAHAPYSGFRVGAALRGRDGAVHRGCNVENASYGLTICAERSAVVKAVGEGVREIAAVAVWADSDVPAPPCGACLQVLAEFSPDPGAVAVLLGCRAGARETTLGALLPEPFRFGQNPSGLR